MQAVLNRPGKRKSPIEKNMKRNPHIYTFKFYLSS